MPRSFDELEIWKQAHRLTLLIYELTTSWPKNEIYGLISQTRRACVSVELNIAEGHGRYHDKEMIRFLIDARASAQEVRNCLMIARDLKEFGLDTKIYNQLSEDYLGLIKGINGLINYLRERNKQLIS
jgi:four helix bundle protein